MKLSKLFRLGKQGYDMYRSYKGHGRYGSGYGHSRGYSSSGYGGGSRRGGTLERLLRRLLK